MSAILRKFSLVLWKNFVIRKRHWLLTLFEIAIPIILFAIMALIKSNVNTTHGPAMDTTYFSTTNLEIISRYFRFSNPVVYYTPDSEPQRTIMNRVKEKLRIKEISPLSSESELVDRMLGQNDSDTRYGYGVVFEGSVGTKFNYKIRPEGRHWYTDTLYPSAVVTGPSQNSDSYFTDFISLQHALDTSFIEYVSETSPLPFDYTMQRFPYPAYVEEFNMSDLNRIMLPIMTVLSFLMLCPSILKRVVEEKHTGVKELMKMMGLKTWMLWSSWMVNALVVNLITVTIIVILMTVPLNDSGMKVMPDADWSVLWLFLVLYCVASVMSLFAVSTFFSRPTIAMSFGIILWLVSYFVPFGALQSGNSVSLGLKMLSSLLPNMAVYWGFDIFSTFEARGLNLSWTKLGDSPSGSGNDLTMLHVILMLLVDIIIYSLVTWYVDAIMPGKYGLAQPWYFVFTCSFWRVGRVESLGVDAGDKRGEHLNFESPPDGVKVGIEIKGLRKVFYKFGGMTKKVAVDGVTMDVYQGQITALLGHNGAGKTTTMSVLTGMYSPTSGSVFVDGYDIRHDMDKVRESLGLCPQHNLLFTDLTVIEHLMFFAMLKGSSRQSARTEANSLLGRLNLKSKSNQLADTLSGGMKRKLSLAIALIGESKVLMLDEPTSGMDPEARREIWDLLLSMRGHRTILITTHFMEEADVLGDFIAIMDHGRVHCYGTSLFLKNIYGTGYHLKLMRQEQCDVARITRLIQETVPQSAPSSSVGTELSYTLPSEQVRHFPALFDILDRDKAALGVTGIGVSITTLEEVFLKVGVEAGEEQRGNSRSSSEVTDSQLLIKNGLGEDLVYNRAKGISLFLQQLRALFIKKVIYTYRKIFIHVLMGLIPVAMIALTIILGSQGTASSSNQEPPRTFSLGDYRPDTVPFTVNDTAVPATLSDSYQRLVGSSPLTSESVSSSVLALGLKNIVDYNNKLVVGAEFSTYNDTTTTVNAMFSTRLFHAAPVSLNVLNNAVLGYLMGSDYTITATNHPLPNNQNSGSLYLLSETDVIFQWMTLVPLGLLFLAGLFMIFPLTERVTSVKQLQLMAGVSPPSYWLICFLWDYLLYLLVSVLMVLVVYAFDALNIFKQTEELCVLFLILALYGLSGIPFAYFFSYLNKTPAGGFVLLIVTNMVVGLIMTMVVYALGQSPDYEATAMILTYIMNLLPHFALSKGLMNYSQQVVKNNECALIRDIYKKTQCEHNPTSKCCVKSTNSTKDYPYLGFYSKSNPCGVGVELVYLGLDMCLYAALILLLDYGLVGWAYERLLKAICKTRPLEGQVDADVAKEQDRVDGQIADLPSSGTILSRGHRYELVPMSGDPPRSSCKPDTDLGLAMRGAANPEEDILVAHELEKCYGLKRFHAVKGISFGVRPGECFGLLGVNGAGKTTTFKMLTGDEVPTQGNAYLGHRALSRDRRQFLSQLGYCPQFDALNETLTGQEMLQLFAHLRGTPREAVSHEVAKWTNLLGLQEYATRLCGTYSGGNKRKLSTAMALIGDPPIVFLDEPTSGVDPVARRNLWNVLAQIQSTGQSIVLTSHSMEECEALCNRLAIMVNGQFVCMGGCQYLKHKFGQGFTVMIKLRSIRSEDNLKELKRAVEEQFQPSCVLKDEHQGLLHYHIQDPHVPWKVLFLGMERLKGAHQIVEDYTISETTLEQVFLAFARAQKQGN